jgi:hypothetical protein
MSRILALWTGLLLMLCGCEAITALVSPPDPKLV